MTCLFGARGLRDALALGWFVLLGASQLATSAVDECTSDECGGTGGAYYGPSILVTAEGPTVTLSDSTPSQTFSVTAVVPELDDDETWTEPGNASATLSVEAEHSGADGADDETPWISVGFVDAREAIVGTSPPFLTSWSSGQGFEMVGNCTVPDPSAPDPCRLAFRVNFERAVSGDPDALSELSWNLELNVPWADADAEDAARFTVEIEPL